MRQAVVLLHQLDEEWRKRRGSIRKNGRRANLPGGRFGLGVVEAGYQRRLVSTTLPTTCRFSRSLPMNTWVG